MEKHKSKYKKPENKKPTYRKDLKDYTLDDKQGKLNPKTTGDKQLNVLRKTDKEMQDDGKMYPTYKDDDRLYKDIEDGDYDPKTAAKRFKKRQDTEEKEVTDVLKDKIENLTREGKERLVREYIRRKIVKLLKEQPTPAPEEPVEDPAAEAPAPEAPAPEAPAPEAPAPEAPEAPAPTAPAAPAPEPPAAPTPSPTAELDPAAKEVLSVERFAKYLHNETGNISRIKALSKVFNSVFKEAEPEDVHNFYKMLRTLSLKKLASSQTPQEKTTK
jgi:hypothetical protein